MMSSCRPPALVARPRVPSSAPPSNARWRYHRCMAMKHAGASERAHQRAADLFRALSEPARLQIVHTLACGERRVCDLAADLGLAQSTTSAHLAILRDRGLLRVRSQGRSSYYSLASSELLEWVRQVETVLMPGPVSGGPTAGPAPGSAPESIPTQPVPAQPTSTQPVPTPPPFPVQARRPAPVNAS
ncbi:MAG TPA: metalloregulator ArsR/SmtB family transcription factor [Beutenbergiaceae bacterium]|nr:metalloregulator ArsR/SmtB family transcription factor [Beutenbergiaceae bacterium]